MRPSRAVPVHEQPEFAVTLVRNGETRIERFRTETRQLAVRAAEAAAYGFTPVEVLVTFEVAGRCGECGAVLFADDRPRPAGTGLRCRDC